MASAKETPRQKLIGIMYLILLALLALQVSSAIMEKFKYIDDTMRLTNQRLTLNGDKLEKSVEKRVAELGNNASDVQLLQQGQQVRKEASLARKHIEELRAIIIKETGGYEDPKDPNSMFVGAKDEGAIEDLMIGAKRAVALQKVVNGYCANLRKITGNDKDFSNLALEPSEDPRISQYSEQKKKSFAEFNFAGTPMVAAMAVLGNMEAEVIKYELQALESIQDRVGGYSFDVDKMIPMYRADANTVVAGTKYKAEVFLGATSSTLKPLISANGKNLEVNADGIGKLEFLASSDKYDSYGYALKKWSGKVTFKNKGRDTSFVINGEYKVAKPYVDIQASTAPALYRNCSNDLKINCPALGAEFNPTYNGTTGGEIIKTDVPGKISIVPDKPELKLKITNNGAFIDEKKFRVLLVPKPIIKLYNGTKEVNQKEGLKLPLPLSLKVLVKADENFSNICPKDCKYNASEVTAYVIRGSTLLCKPIEAKNGFINLSEAIKLGVKPTDRIFIETKKIQRANFRNQIEDVNITETWNLTIADK